MPQSMSDQWQHEKMAQWRGCFWSISINTTEQMLINGRGRKERPITVYTVHNSPTTVGYSLVESYLITSSESSEGAQNPNLGAMGFTVGLVRHSGLVHDM